MPLRPGSPTSGLAKRLWSRTLFVVLLAGLIPAGLGLGWYREAGAVGAVVPGAAANPSSHAELPTGPRADRRAARPADRPNIVFVLTDDLSTNLLPYMPHVLELQRRGLTFSRYFVTNSLCCPSRSSILTGGYPHTTQVLTNGGPDGGYAEFHYRRNDERTFATSLDAAGYTTALMGKYLNGYWVSPARSTPLLSIPPGWDEWYVAGGRQGYSGFDYTLNENGLLVDHGHEPQDYITDVLSAKAVDFVHRVAGTGSPLLLEVSTFSPHLPYTPAPRNAEDYPGLTYPRTPAFDAATGGAPRWLGIRKPLSAKVKDNMDTAFRMRAQAVRSVDDLIKNLMDALEAEGMLDDTYIVFSSDNGYHMGEYRLRPGKMTAYDTDIHVPLIIAGPGVPAGITSDALVANIDLCPTFEELGHGEPTSLVDGHSLVPLLAGEPPAEWRRAVLIEHRRPETAAQAGPDRQAPTEGPPSYSAMRLRNALYVEYADGEFEYYDLVNDPYELHDLAPRLTPARRQSLSRSLAALVACRGTQACTAEPGASP